MGMLMRRPGRWEVNAHPWIKIGYGKDTQK